MSGGLSKGGDNMEVLRNKNKVLNCSFNIHVTSTGDLSELNVLRNFVSLDCPFNCFNLIKEIMLLLPKSLTLYIEILVYTI